MKIPKLKYHIEKRKRIYVVVGNKGDCRPATIQEVYFARMANNFHRDNLRLQDIVRELQDAITYYEK